MESDYQPHHALSHGQFYLLLALLRVGQVSAYTAHTVANNYACGALEMAQGQAYKTIRWLVAQGLAEEAGRQFASKHEVMHYRVTKEGIVRVRLEYRRMKFAMQVIDAHGDLLTAASS